MHRTLKYDIQSMFECLRIYHERPRRCSPKLSAPRGVPVLSWPIFVRAGYDLEASAIQRDRTPSCAASRLCIEGRIGEVLQPASYPITTSCRRESKMRALIREYFKPGNKLALPTFRRSLLASRQPAVDRVETSSQHVIFSCIMTTC